MERENDWKLNLRLRIAYSEANLWVGNGLAMEANHKLVQFRHWPLRDRENEGDRERKVTVKNYESEEFEL